MSSTDAAWKDLNDAVLATFNVVALTAGDVKRALRAVPDAYIRAALSQHVEWGYLTVKRGPVRVTYTLTEAGRAHLTAVKVA